MTTSPSTDTASNSTSNGASPSSLPRWRQWLSMLNWRRDPGYEQRKMQHEQRMKQLESDILRVRSDSERIKREAEQLRQENAREKALSASIRRLCFPPESSSIPSDTNRARLQTFLSLIGGISPPEEESL